MTIRTLRAALLGRLRSGGPDDRGSLPMLMMVIIATAALGGIMLTNIIGASKSSSFAQLRVRSLAAAQSGIDAIVGQLRAASSSTDAGTGDSGRLPCYPSTSPLTSSTTGAPSANDAASTSYKATVYYYSVDPATLGSTDLNTDMPGGKRMLCSPSAGPYNPTDQVRTPKYALITSTGYGTPGSTATSRTVQTTYNFQVLNQNIDGGVIRLYPRTTTQANQWCMDAGSNPVAGSAITLQPCSASTPPASRQVFEYRQDLSIELVSSTNNPDVAGLCIDTTAQNSGKHTAGDAIVLAQCAVSDSQVCPSGYTSTTYHAAFPDKTCSVSPWNQQWSINDNAHLEDANPNNSNLNTSDLNGLCINFPGTQSDSGGTAGVALNLAACGSGTSNANLTWIPSATAGAGMASAATNQLVNFQEFAMCLDDTGQDPTASFMILYTCKQDPHPKALTWNQVWTQTPTPGAGPTQVLITTTKSGTTYCLKSPQTAGGYPVLVAQGSGCPASVAAAGTSSPYVWTVSQKYADDAKTSSLTYANQYTIKDSTTTSPAGGLCLGIGGNSDLYINVYTKAIVTTCDGSNGQKWNASAITSAATLTNTTELGSDTGS